MEALEEKGKKLKDRYSRKVEEYCYKRANQAAGLWPDGSEARRYYLFWLNMHLLLGLMKTGGK